MTEADWLSKSQHPIDLFWRVRGKGRSRRLRLCAAACCRRIARLLPDPRCLKAVEVAEAFAEGVAKRAALLAAAKETPQSGPDLRTNGEAAAAVAAGSVWHLLQTHNAFASHALQSAVLGALGASFPEAAPWAEEWWLEVDIDHPACAAEIVAQAALARDIFRQCFRPVTFDPVCRTPTVLSLAQATYDERSLPSGELEAARLAVLADALEEAGCNNTDILAHLRGPGPHVRGCWALDLILGKQ